VKNEKEIHNMIMNIIVQLPDKMSEHKLVCLFSGILQSYDMTPHTQLSVIKGMTLILHDIAKGNTAKYSSFKSSNRKH